MVFSSILSTMGQIVTKKSLSRNNTKKLTVDFTKKHCCNSSNELCSIILKMLIFHEGICPVALIIKLFFEGLGVLNLEKYSWIWENF